MFKFQLQPERSRQFFGAQEAENVCSVVARASTLRSMSALRACCGNPATEDGSRPCESCNRHTAETPVPLPLMRTDPPRARLDSTTVRGLAVRRNVGLGSPTNSQPGRLRYVAKASGLRVLAASSRQFWCYLQDALVRLASAS